MGERIECVICGNVIDPDKSKELFSRWGYLVCSNECGMEAQKEYKCPICDKEYKLFDKSEIYDGFITLSCNKDKRDNPFLFTIYGLPLGHADKMQGLIDRMKGGNKE